MIVTSKKERIPLEERSHALIRRIPFCVLIPHKPSLVKHPTQRLLSGAARQLQSSRLPSRAILGDLVTFCVTLCFQFPT